MKKKTLMFLCSLLLLQSLFGFQHVALNKVEQDTIALEEACQKTANILMDESEIPEEAKIAMKKQQPALCAYEKLWDYFEKDEIGLPVYPEEYGGEYIDSDTLVIQLIQNSKMEEKYREICDFSKNIRFESVEYSINYLLSLRDIVNDLMEEYSIIGYELDVRNNQLLIHVTKDEYHKLMQNEMIISLENAVNIDIVEKPVMCASDIYGGDSITKSNGQVFTMCIGGTYSGNAAILTCGHGMVSGESLTRNGNSLGTVVFQRCNNSQLKMSTQTSDSYGDYAIIQVNTSNFNRTNKVRYSTTGTRSITGVYNFPPVGTTVYKYGNVSHYVTATIDSHYNSGEFIMLQNGLYSQSYYLNGITKLNLTGGGVNGVLTAGGDSGGCVYVKNGSAYNICGSITAGSGTVGYYSPVTYPTSLGFVSKTN